MNGEVCCILGVCCPPERASRALAREMVKAGFDTATSDKAADWIMANFDLAPPGTIGTFKSEIGRIARAHKDE